MSFKHVWIVFKKEVKDIARDKKTILTNLLVPIILMPLIFFIMGGSFKRLGEDINENVTVALSSNSNTREIIQLVQEKIFADYPNIKLNGVVEDPIQAIRNNEVRFVIDVEENFAESLKQELPYTITILFDHSDTKSSGSYEIIAQAVNKYRDSIIRQRLESKNIDLSLLEPVKVVLNNAADEKTGGNFMIMMMLPMLISVLIAVAGIPAATDLVAGEKERATLEPLLTTQAGRMSILLGKYFTVTLFSIVGVIAQFIGVLIGFATSPDFLNMGGEASSQMSFYFPPLAMFLVILITISMGMVFAGLQLAVSTYAKSFKEAQTYLSFFILIAMVPAYATMMLQPSDIELYMFFVPLLNAIASLKMVLGNVINYTYLEIALATSFIYVAISLLFAASLFKKEKVLFRS